MTADSGKLRNVMLLCECEKKHGSNYSSIQVQTLATARAGIFSFSRGSHTCTDSTYFGSVLKQFDQLD